MTDAEDYDDSFDYRHWNNGGYQVEATEDYTFLGENWSIIRYGQQLHCYERAKPTSKRLLG